MNLPFVISCFQSCGRGGGIEEEGGMEWEEVRGERGRGEERWEEESEKEGRRMNIKGQATD